MLGKSGEFPAVPCLIAMMVMLLCLRSISSGMSATVSEISIPFAWL